MRGNQEARTLTAGEVVQRRVLHRPRQPKLLHHAIQALLEYGSAVSSTRRAVAALPAGVTPAGVTHAGVTLAGVTHAGVTIAGVTCRNGAAARAQRLHSGPRAHESIRRLLPKMEDRSTRPHLPLALRQGGRGPRGGQQ